MASTFVDRGGTFTDVVTFSDDGSVRIRKVPSDRAVVGLLAEGDLTFGTTVATNALLEHTGVPVALLTTAGFEDLVRIGDMTRPDLFDPDARWPDPLVTRVVGIEERCGPNGEQTTPLALPEDLDLDGIQSVAIALLHGPAAPEHEDRLAAFVRARWPHLHVSIGHALDPAVGLLPRLHTTLVDAAITPVLRDALDRDRIPAGARAMRSDGSLVDAAELRAPEAVLSGPAGGVLAVAAVARAAGFERAVGLDMGGTSTDVCRVEVGDLPRREGHVEVAGVRLRRPMLEVETIAAGGGSVLASDGLRLSVGPRSAGADPGPQCYGRGGPPTLTDAALAAGLVDPDAFDPPLQPERIDLPGPADAFLDIAREAMAGAVRRLAVARGIDLHDHALVSYGGAAGQHACEVAARLGIGTVLVHPCTAVLSAFGQALARRAEEAQEAVWGALDTHWDTIATRVERLAADLPDLDERAVHLGLRVRGTDHALDVPWSAGDDLPDVRARFVAAHRDRYGFDREDVQLELAWVRVRSTSAERALPRLQIDPFSLGGATVRGPSVLRSDTTSVVVPDGWEAHLDGEIVRIEHRRRAPRAEPTARTPHGAALWGHRFMAVATQAGETLRRLARSVNIRERLDFSCAVFDEAGQLVANAPHIPVHLGAMGETVRDVIANVPDLADGQAWLTNDPGAGGSHLPDLTVVTAVHHQGRCFFVASRGHHVDVGGTTPGSMPPRSARLSEEGVVFRRLALLDGGRLRRDLAAHLAGCRQPDVVRADLEAQIAANAHAARLLRELGDADLLAAWMVHLQDVAADAVAALLPSLAAASASDRVEDLPLQVAVAVRGGRLRVDFSGTGGPHAGNLNAPPAVVRAAVLYTLRVLVDRPIPLNEGALRAVDLVLPSPSLLDPPAGAAVAGGNVETSQRIVDALLLAFGRSAAGPGSMSNLTLGGQGWSLYETIGGGSGGTPRSYGASGRQVHMTNTRATDPEVLERRLPLRVRRFSLRPGSGGPGEHPGGDGLVREIELRAPGSAALLAAWREGGAPGLGGGSGAPGQAFLVRGEERLPWDGEPVDLDVGDAVRVETPGGGGSRGQGLR